MYRISSLYDKTVILGQTLEDISFISGLKIPLYGLLKSNFIPKKQGFTGLSGLDFVAPLTASSMKVVGCGQQCALLHLQLNSTVSLIQFNSKGFIGMTVLKQMLPKHQNHL